MKKFLMCFPLMLMLSTMPVLAGCTAATKPEPPLANSSINGGASLVVYFSWSGNTEQMAGWIADESGSELYRVTPGEAYSEDFESCADRAKNELDNGIRPELTGLMYVETMAQYDTIYVGFPIGWYDLPMAMTTFLEQYDLSGKTIIPFFSHNGSSSGASAPETLTKICTDAAVLTDKALSIPGSDVEKSETQIREWVRTVKQ